MDPQKVNRIPAQDHQQGLRPHYTQVNILFPSEQVELPDANKFKAFPPEAQKAILIAFEKEQTERHLWLKNQQMNEHLLNMQNGKHFFVWKLSGLAGGVLLSIVIFVTGAWLVAHGASTIGIAAMITTVAGLVGTAVFGHKSKGSESKDSDESAITQKEPENSN